MLFSIIVEDLASATDQEKEMKSINIGKKYKTALFVDKTICINPMVLRYDTTSKNNKTMK